MKTFIRLTMAMAMLIPVAAITAGPASAAPIVTCAKPSGAVKFTPGLGTTPKIQTTTFNLPIKGCKGGGVTGGTSKGSTKGTTKDTCKSFGGASSTKTTVTITWNTKKTSTATLATKIVPGAPGVLTATVTGKITKGLFLGKVVKTTVKVAIHGSCTDAKPLTSATLTGLKPFTIG